MRKRDKIILIVPLVFLTLAAAIVISIPTIQYQLAYRQARHAMDALREGLHPFDQELPVLQPVAMSIPFEDPEKKSVYDVTEGIHIEVPDTLIRPNDKRLRFQTDKLEVTVISSEINDLGLSGVDNLSNSKAKEYFIDYFKETSRYQMAKDVFGASLNAMRVAKTNEERYKNLYLYSMKAVLLPYTAKERAVEFSTGSIKGFLFGIFPESDAMLADVCSADEGPFVVFYFKNRGDATAQDVEALLSTVTIKGK